MKVAGSIRVPGDKSISHRALMLASISAGTSRIRGILQSGDIESTARVLRGLGVSVPPLNSEMEISGAGRRGLAKPSGALDCGNSGTTARLVSGIIAGQPLKAKLTGDESLRRRPMRRVADPLTSMGARIEFEKADGLPMTVGGAQLHGIDWNTGTASAQVKSAILLAGVVSNVGVTVRETGRSRDHTERMLRAAGCRVQSKGTVTTLSSGDELEPLDVDVPADPSSAAFLAALAALADSGEIELTEVCVNPTRSGFLRALMRMGGSVHLEGMRTISGEDVATVRVRPARLRDLQIAAADVPSLIDEIPLLACVAAGAGTRLEIGGASELRVKESDRIRSVVSNLKAVGADAEELPDGFRVTGEKRALSGTVRTEGDHRVAMAFGVLGSIPGNEIEIDDRECASISYPQFWSDLRRVIS